MKKIFTCISIMMMLVGMQVSAQEPTMQLGPTDSFGFLNGPDGEMWTYTASFEKKYGMYTCVKVQVYDAQNQLVGAIVDSLKIDDENVTGINQAEIDGLVTERFFDSNANSYEVMLFLHATTKDYEGLYINHVFSLAEGETVTTPIKTVEGVRVAAQNMGDYNENYVMVFQRDSAKNNADEHTLCFDVRRRATFGGGVDHTFRVPYANVAALNDLQPFYMLKNGKFINYVVQQYEKPYFVPGTPYNQDPVVTENNNLVISYLNQSYKELTSTKIPIVQDANEKLLYTFPKLGGLNGSKDIVLGADGSVSSYVITLEKYNLEDDGSVNSYFLYDVASNQQKTIAENTKGSVMMSPVVGQEDQWMFIKEEYDGEFFFVDLPSCEPRAEISVYLEDGRTISSQIDRYPKGDSYEYAVALLQGNNEADGTISQDIAWLNADGSFNRYENINLGKYIEAAQVNITADALNPWVIHTDDAREYMVLVKRYNPKNTKDKETAFLVCNTKGEILLDYGKDEEKGELNMVYLMDKGANPSILCVYQKNGVLTMHYTPLPLNNVALQGAGTAVAPYQLTCPNDFKLINNAPMAHYVVANDIDFLSVPFEGVKNVFGGKLDGQNYKLSNMCLVGGGLFGEMVDSVSVSNLVLENPTLVLTDKHMNIATGILANTMQGGGEEGTEIYASLSNVHMMNPVVKGVGYENVVGTLVGEANLYLDVNTCSVTGAEITAPTAQVGGLVGSANTSTNIHACLFTGTAKGGDVVGGIVGAISSDAPVYDCRVDADLYSSQTVGGVVGKSGRALINNCYAEGTITLSDTAKVGKVGGIVGEVSTDATGTSTDTLVMNCLVGVSAITVPDGKDVIAHRVVGFSSGDSYEYDWDKITDYNSDKSEWPRVYFPAEKGFKDNYVISDLAALDANVQMTDTTTEGANLAWANVTVEWLGKHGYQLGENVDAPWEIGDNLVLWYESDLTTDVENVWGEGSDVVSGKPMAKKLIINGQMYILRHDGLYNASGARVR